ncbi:unnamed protein product, partial [Polarella glacialis]
MSIEVQEPRRELLARVQSKGADGRHLRQRGTHVLRLILEATDGLSQEQRRRLPRRPCTGGPSLPSQATLEALLLDLSEARTGNVQVSARELLAAVPDVQHLSLWQLTYLRLGLPQPSAELEQRQSHANLDEALRRLAANLDRFLCEAFFREAAAAGDGKLFPLKGSRAAELGGLLLTALGLLDTLVGDAASAVSSLPSCWRLPSHPDYGPTFLEFSAAGRPLLRRQPTNEAVPLICFEPSAGRPQELAADADCWEVDSWDVFQEPHVAREERAPLQSPEKKQLQLQQPEEPLPVWQQGSEHLTSHVPEVAGGAPGTGGQKAPPAGVLSELPPQRSVRK